MDAETAAKVEALEEAMGDCLLNLRTTVRTAEALHVIDDVVGVARAFELLRGSFDAEPYASLIQAAVERQRARESGGRKLEDF